MKTDKLKVYAKQKEYFVHITNGKTDLLPQLVKETCAGKRAALISDTNVFPLYGEKVRQGLENVGYIVFPFVLDAGEQSKNTANLLDILSFLSANGFDRHDVVLSLGGGVVGDISGLASSLYMRGTRLVHIPTSLLAMVDSCVGGKTAVDTEYGKNAIGTFYEPDLVLCDTSFLGTLPKNEYVSGMAEVIKYGVISDKKLFEKLKNNTFTDDEIIADCLRIKKALVGCDERDNGIRHLLNFGHTFGHAVEKLSSYTVAHGSAVAIGMVIASKLGEKLSICGREVTEEIVCVNKKYGLPTECEFSASRLAELCVNDKKSDGDTISLVLPEKIGKCIIKDIKKTELKGLAECI